MAAVLEHRPDDFGRDAAGGEHDFAGQIEGWIFLVGSGLALERLLGAVSITFRPISAAKAWSYGWNIRRANGSYLKRRRNRVRPMIGIGNECSRERS